jgi:predicted amidohydrolase YtcJ
MAYALAQFEEKEKGSLAAGKYAEIVMLSNNLLTCKEEEISGTRVMMTRINGKVVYKGK